SSIEFHVMYAVRARIFPPPPGGSRPGITARGLPPKLLRPHNLPMLYVIFPAFNEEKVIAPTLAALADAMRDREHYRAVLVDGGAPHGPGPEAGGVAAERSLLLPVLRHETNRGLGAGLRTGIYWCLDRAGENDVIVTLDADNPPPPALIPTLV